MNAPLSQKDIFKMWWPLAATWLLMALEGPFVSALIARQTNAIIELGAFGVVYALGLVLEAPVIMLMASSVRLVADANSYKSLRRFALFLNLLVSISVLVLLIPNVFTFLSSRMLQLTPETAQSAYKALWFLIPWPAAIGYRRFYQGILIRHSKTSYLVYATLVRLLSLSICALSLFWSEFLTGASIATFSLSLGACCEALVVRLFVKQSLSDIKNKPDLSNPQELSFKRLLQFYLPLAATGVLGLVAQPIVTLGMNLARMPLESLAVIPVINGLTFIFRAIPLSMQELTISYLSRHAREPKPIRKFAFFLSLSLFFILALIVLTPLRNLWLEDISGLSSELSDFSFIPLVILLPTPVFSLWLSMQRAYLIDRKKSKPITWASILELSMIVLLLFIFIRYLDFVGVVAASWSLILARLCAITFLHKQIKL